MNRVLVGGLSMCLLLAAQAAKADPPICVSETYTHGVERIPDDVAGTTPPVIMKRVTDSSEGSQLSYYDIPFWSTAVNRMITNLAVDIPNRRWDVVSSDVDGKHSYIIAHRVSPTISADRVDLSPDGRLISYTKVNPSETSWDVYAIDLLGDGCEHRVTHEHYPLPTTGPDLIKTSPAVFDAVAQKYLIAYANVSQLYLVYDDGTAPCQSTHPYLVPLHDRNAADSFHRVRLNPVFSNLILFRRDCRHQGGCSSQGGAAPQMYVTDWTVHPEHPMTRKFYNRDDKGGGHEQWTPDGTKIGAVNGPRKNTVTSTWVEYVIADSDGHLLTDVTPRTVQYQRIGVNFGQGSENGKVFFASYSPDGQVIAVATGVTSDQGTCVPGRIFLMNPYTGNILMLSKTFTDGKTLLGAPKLGFYDGLQVGFSSDTACIDQTMQGKIPQVYLTSRNTSLP